MGHGSQFRWVMGHGSQFRWVMGHGSQFRWVMGHSSDGSWVSGSQFRWVSGSWVTVQMGQWVMGHSSDGASVSGSQFRWGIGQWVMGHSSDGSVGQMGHSSLSLTHCLLCRAARCVKSHFSQYIYNNNNKSSSTDQRSGTAFQRLCGRRSYHCSRFGET